MHAVKTDLNPFKEIGYHFMQETCKTAIESTCAHGLWVRLLLLFNGRWTRVSRLLFKSSVL